MELITLQSEVWKQLQSQIEAIHKHFEIPEEETYKNVWLNHHEVCVYLKISSRTLTRIRKAGEITYSENRRQYFYTIGAIQELLDKRAVSSKDDYIEALVAQAKHHLKQ
ncbi:MAG: helix-turn-helix domain-containing protein [Polaribacter sp.]